MFRLALKGDEDWVESSVQFDEIFLEMQRFDWYLLENGDLKKNPFHGTYDFLKSYILLIIALCKYSHW